MEETRLTRKYEQPTCHAKTYIKVINGVETWYQKSCLRSWIEQSCLIRPLQSSVLTPRVYFTTENERFFAMGGFYNKFNSSLVCKWKWRIFVRKWSKRLFKIAKVSLIQICFLSSFVSTVVCTEPAFLLPRKLGNFKSVSHFIVIIWGDVNNIVKILRLRVHSKLYTMLTNCMQCLQPSNLFDVSLYDEA